ncbi:MAG: sugar ABC transporter substrate-binding protein [Oscillospiraceae bacterium]|nr:sugar ABC transporter substrate-binding protein [Oscillospiraceae bacterium]MCL2277809.1 sugar ABC transporter substrate-binding protein [Oscillospiraceae bacterium]
MKKRILATILAMALMVALLAACAPPEQAAAPIADPDAPVFEAPRAPDEVPGAGYPFPGAVGSSMVLMLKDYTNPVWIEAAAGARAAAEHFGIGDLLIQAPVVSNDNLEQIQLIEQAIARGLDIYVLIPSDSIGIVPAVYSLNEANIPVINLNTWINAEGTNAFFETFIIADNYTCAQYAAHQLAYLAGGEGEVVLLQGPSGGQVTIDLTRGAVDTFALYPGIEIVDMVDARFERATAYMTMQNLLQAHPNLRMVFSCNDEMALGALAALEAAGRRNNDENHIFIGGIDGNQEAIRAVLEGRLDFTVDKSFFRQGWAGVEIAAMFLDGHTLPELIPLEIHLITIDNAADFLN